MKFFLRVLYYFTSRIHGRWNLFKLRYFIYTQQHENATFYNFWKGFDGQFFWFKEFIKTYKLNPAYRPLIFICVFGNVLARKKFKKQPQALKVFWTCENLELGYKPYADHLVNHVDLALGFSRKIKNPNYFRYPLWVLYLFSYNATLESIREKIAELNNPTWKLSIERDRFCAMVASHNSVHRYIGVRQILYDALSRIGHIDSAGKFLHNTDELQTTFSNNKIAFLKHYRFNICPENSCASGYVTEKVVEAMQAGCVPIYWGGENANEILEDGIFNESAILRLHNLSGGGGKFRRTRSARACAIS